MLFSISLYQLTFFYIVFYSPTLFLSRSCLFHQTLIFPGKKFSLKPSKSRNELHQQCSEANPRPRLREKRSFGGLAAYSLCHFCTPQFHTEGRPCPQRQVDGRCAPLLGCFLATKIFLPAKIFFLPIFF